jgi:Ca2+-binding RTX toxin-like protein
MARTLDTWNFDGDYHRIVAGGGPVALDWGGNAEVISGYGILDVQVGVWGGGATLQERFGIISGMGVTLSNGFQEGSEISINGFPAVVAPGGNGVNVFHIWFPDPERPWTTRAAPPSVVQTFLRALTYENTAETIPDDFSRLVSVIISNDGDGTTGHEFEQEFVTFTKWLPRHGPDTGGPGDDNSGGGGNLPPKISGYPTHTTISDGGVPFSQVSVSDENGDNLTLTAGIGQADRAYFLDSGLSSGTYNAATGLYVISGTSAQVQAALQKLVLVAIPRSESAPASLESITLTITVSDGKASTSASLTADMWVNRADVLRGKSTSEKLYGYSGKDKLYGNGGNDKLFGGAGSDTLDGGAGKDAFVFDTKANTRTNKDKIVDFKVKDDSIWLDNAVFTKLGKAGSEARPAQLKSSYFTIGDKAKDKNDYLVYNDKKGVLLYDADGSGRGKAVEIATLSKKLAMTYKDFFVI